MPDAGTSLPARTRIPVPGPDTVPRRTLLRDLTRLRDDVRLVSLVAPPGAGKTTALAQWATTDPGDFAWVRVTADDDPMRLMREIALALHRLRPVDDTLWRIVADADAAAAELTVPRILLWLRLAERPVTLVLDDAHHLRQQATARALLELTDSLPPGCRLVLSGRSRPRLRLSRLRMRGACHDLGTSSLAFTVAETIELLRLTDPDLDAQAARRSARQLVACTEGWAAGIRLAVLARAETPSSAPDLRYAEEYLWEEVLDPLPDDAVEFLLRTSVLQQLSGPLCDAVLERAGSAARLADLHGSTLFVTALPGLEGWYRYHRCLAATLRAELRRRHPEEVPGLCLRASRWSVEHEHPDEAVHYALTGGDTAEAARLLTARVQSLHAEGRLETARAWLAEMPPAVLAGHPPAAVAALWVWVFTGDASRAAQCLTIAGACSYDGPMPDGSASYRAALARARALVAPQGVEGMLTDARLAVELEPPGSPWHTMARALHGTAQLLTGWSGQAVTSLEQAARAGGEAQSPGVSFALAQLSLIAAGREDWAAAGDHAEEAHRIAISAGLEGNITTLLVHAARARVGVHLGDPAARDHVDRALSLYGSPSPRAVPWLAAQAAVVLGELLVDLADLPAAERMAADAALTLAALPSTGMLASWHEQLLHRIAHAGRVAEATAAALLTPAEARILQLLPTHLPVNEIAQVLTVSTNTVKTQVTAVYRKLGVSSRTEAVQRGQELGLLGPWPSLGLPPLGPFPAS